MNVILPSDWTDEPPVRPFPMEWMAYTEKRRSSSTMPELNRCRKTHDCVRLAGHGGECLPPERAHQARPEPAAAPAPDPAADPSRELDDTPAAFLATVRVLRIWTWALAGGFVTLFVALGAAACYLRSLLPEVP